MVADRLCPGEDAEGLEPTHEYAQVRKADEQQDAARDESFSSAGSPSLRRCLRQRSSMRTVSGHKGVCLLPQVLPRGITKRISIFFPIRFVVMCFHRASPMSELPSPALTASVIAAFRPTSATSITARSSCGSKSIRSRGGPLAFSRLLSISHKPGMVIQPSLSQRLNAALTKANRLLAQVGCRSPLSTV